MAVVEALVGRPERIGEILSLDPKAPYVWRHGRGGRCAGDLPQVAYMRTLLSHSAVHNLGLTADHLIWGAEAAEIDEILSRRTPAVAAE